MASKFRIFGIDIPATVTPETSWILPYNDTGADNVLFVVGEVITGAAGATGTILSVTGTATTGTLVVTLTNSISFIDGEVLTGSIAGIADVNSATGGTASSTLILFDQDPLFGTYDPISSNDDRGSVFKTLAGNVVQDFGTVVSDEVITFSDSEALSTSTIDKLVTAYATVDGQFYFTDGYNCWKVQFSRRPKGFRSLRNILWSYHGSHYFSYDINLMVISKDI
jgi:hypothetical protein